MSEGGSGEAEFSSPVERDLHGKLGVVREHSPQPRTDLERRVSRTLRWQRLLALPLTAATALVGGLLGGLRSLAGPRERRS